MTKFTDNPVRKKSYYIISIADLDGNRREKRSKKAPVTTISTKRILGTQFLDRDAFSSLARQLRWRDSLAKIDWYWGDRQIGSTGWFPVAADPEIVKPLAEKADRAREELRAKHSAERGET